MKKPMQACYPWLLWLLAAGVYFYAMIFRLAPSSLGPQWVVLFPFVYALLQFPIGIMIDKFGARRLLMIGAFTVGCGAVVFALTSSITLVEMGRFIWGVGSIFGFVGMVYFVAHWFDRKKWPLLIAIGSSIGMIGALIGEGVMKSMVNKWGYPVTLLISAIVAFGIAALFMTIAKNQSRFVRQEGEKDKIKFWPAMKTIFTSRQVWLMASVSIGYTAFILMLVGYWGAAFLQVSNNFSQDMASFATSMIYFGFALGGPLIAHVADKINKYREAIIIFLLLTLITSSSLIYFSPLADGAVFLLMFCIGFCASAQLLIYPLAIEIIGLNLKGGVVSFIYANCLLFAAVLEPITSWILHLSSNGASPNTLEEYRLAFTLFVVLQAVGFLTSFLIPQLKKRKIGKGQHHANHEDKQKAA